MSGLYKYTPGLLVKITNPKISKQYDLPENAELFCVESRPSVLPIATLSIHAYLTDKNKKLAKKHRDMHGFKWEHCIDVWHADLTIARPYLPGLIEFNVGDKVLIDYPKELGDKEINLVEGVIRGIERNIAAVEIVTKCQYLSINSCVGQEGIKFVPSGKGVWVSAQEMYPIPSEEDILFYLDLTNLVEQKKWPWYKRVWEAIKNWWDDGREKNRKERIRNRILKSYLTYINADHDIQLEIMGRRCIQNGQTAN